MNIWFTLLQQPLLNGLIGFYQLFGNVGVSIVAVSVLIKLILTPLTLPSLKAAGKMKELGPKIDRLKKKYKDDKKGFAKAQMELYKQEGVNPAAGCLPQILQIVVLIAFLEFCKLC